MNSEDSAVPEEKPKPAMKYCEKCDFRAETIDRTCARCGVDLVDERQVRAFSTVPLIAGVTTSMVSVVGYLTVLKVHAGRQVFRADDALTLKLKTGIFIVLGVVGLLIVAASLHQMATGKFYGRLLKILIAATIVVGAIIEIYFAYLHSW